MLNLLVIRNSCCFWIFIILLSITFSGCSQDDFNESCIDTRNILFKAKEKIGISNVSNLNSDGGIGPTIVKLDSTKARKYLEIHAKSIKENYYTIKTYYDSNSDRCDDALYVIAFINDFMYWLLGEPLENHCTYLEKVISERPHSPSVWIMDNFFSWFVTSKDKSDAWKNMDAKQKYVDIYEYLTLSLDKKCPNLYY